MLVKDLDIKVGDTFYSDWWAVQIFGEFIDLSSDGWVVRAQVRDSDVSTEPLLSLGIALAVGTVTIDGTPVSVSVTRVHIPATATEAIGPFTGRWDLEISNPTFDNGAPFVHTLVGGVARAKRDVTR